MILYYMPNRLMQWNEIVEVGNPTRCLAINDSIKSMKKSEVKNLGIKSTARRAMIDQEFTKIKGLCFQLEDEEKHAVVKYGVSAQMNFQFHLMARLDDCCNVPRENLEIHPNFPFALKTRLNWAKNCNEERERCSIHGKELAENPVEKIALVAHGSDGEIFWMK